MVTGSVFDTAVPNARETPRVDLQRVLTGLRHLTGSAEPGRVFAELAAVGSPTTPCWGKPSGARWVGATRINR